MRHFIIPAMFVVACSASRPEKSFRSPTHDYDPPTAITAADGEVIGTDGMRPADKLATSPRVGTGGFRPAARPPSVESEEKRRQREQQKLCEDSMEGALLAENATACQGR